MEMKVLFFPAFVIGSILLSIIFILISRWLFTKEGKDDVIITFNIFLAMFVMLTAGYFADPGFEAVIDKHYNEFNPYDTVVNFFFNVTASLVALLIIYRARNK